MLGSLVSRLRELVRRLRELPRGVLAVVAVGLGASVLAPLLVSEATGGGRLGYAGEVGIPPSTSERLGEAGVRITDGEMATTRSNFAGYRLFRVSASLEADSNAGISDVNCKTRVGSSALVGRTPNRRAAYPRPSEELLAQEVPSEIVVEFNAEGGELIAVDFNDAISSFSGGRDALVEWAPYEPGEHTFKWDLDPEAAGPVNLDFATFWRTIGQQQARIECVAEGGGKRVKVSTEGTIPLEDLERFDTLEELEEEQEEAEEEG